MHRAAELVRELREAGCMFEVSFRRSVECCGFVFIVCFPASAFEQWRTRSEPRILDLAHEMATLLGAELRN